MNVIAQLEFELAYFDVVVWYVSHYTTETFIWPLLFFCKFIRFLFIFI